MKKIKVSNFIYLLFSLIYFWGQVFISSGLVVNFLLVLVSLGAYIYVFIKRGMDIKKQLVGNSFFSIFMIFSMIYNKNSSFLEILWVFSYFGIASLLYFFPLSEKLCKFIYYTVAIQILVFFFRGIDPNYIFKAGGSRNLISVILLYHMTVYYVVLYNRKKKYDIYPAVFTFLLCVFSLGRAGIIISFLVMSFIAINILKKENKSRIIFIVIILISFYFISKNYLQIFFKNMIERFKNEGIESLRLVLFKEYFNEMKDFINFMYGVPYASTPYLSYYRNPHNSFLVLHSKFGILGCIAALYIMLKYLIKKILRKNIFEIFLGSFIILRSLFDWVAFPGLFDIFFWYIFLDSTKKRRKNEL